MVWEDEELEVSLPAEAADALGVVFTGDSFEVATGRLGRTAKAYLRGLRRGDEIRSINGIRPSNAAHAQTILGRKSIFGDIHKIKVIRPGLHRQVLLPLQIAGLLVLAYLAYRFGPSLGGKGERGEQSEL